VVRSEIVMVTAMVHALPLIRSTVSRADHRINCINSALESEPSWFVSNLSKALMAPGRMGIVVVGRADGVEANRIVGAGDVGILRLVCAGGAAKLALDAPYVGAGRAVAGKATGACIPSLGPDGKATDDAGRAATEATEGGEADASTGFATKELGIADMDVMGIAGFMDGKETGACAVGEGVA